MPTDTATVTKLKQRKGAGSVGMSADFSYVLSKKDAADYADPEEGGGSEWRAVGKYDVGSDTEGPQRGHGTEEITVDQWFRDDKEVPETEVPKWLMTAMRAAVYREIERKTKGVEESVGVTNTTKPGTTKDAPKLGSLLGKMQIYNMREGSYREAMVNASKNGVDPRHRGAFVEF